MIQKTSRPISSRRISELAGSDFVLKNGKKVALGPCDVAILVRANADIQRLLPLLEARNIEYVVDSGQTVFNQDVVLAVHACLDFVFDLSDVDCDRVAKDYRQFLKNSGYRLPRAKTISEELMNSAPQA